MPQDALAAAHHGAGHTRRARAASGLGERQRCGAKSCSCYPAEHAFPGHAGPVRATSSKGWLWPQARSAGEDLGEEVLGHRLPRQLGDLA